MLARDAPPILEEAMAIYKELGDREGLAKSLWGRSEYDFFGGDFSRAVSDLSGALTVFRETGDRFQVAWTLHSIGLAQTVLGAHDDAQRSLSEAIRMFRDDGDVSGMIIGVVDFAGLAFARGNRDLAYRLAAAGDASTRRTGTGLADIATQVNYFPEVPREPAIGSADRAAWDQGARLDLEDAVAEVLAEHAAAVGPVPEGKP
jgi:hypothetical protein